VRGVDLGYRRGSEGGHRDPRQVLGPHAVQEVRGDALEQVLGPDPPGQVGRLLVQARGEQLGHLLVGPVLQEPGEQQVPLLEQGLGLVVLAIGTGQQAGGLELEQGGRDDQELRGHLEVQLPHVPDLRQVLLGDRRQRDLPDIYLLARDEVEEQVERPLEHLGPDDVVHVST